MKITVVAAAAALLMCAGATTAQIITELPKGDVVVDSVVATGSDKADAEEPHMTQAERDAATALGAGFQAQLKAALSQPTNPLYLAALGGSANDKWVWGLALTAERYDTASVPPAQLKTFNAYIKKVDKEKDKYAKKHKDESLPDRSLEEWVPPKPDEAQAVTIVHAINTPDVWLDVAREGVDGALLDQSLACMARLEDQLSTENMMNQLMASFGMDMSEITLELSGGEKDDTDLDNDAVCGGADAWTANKALYKAVFKPKMTISVSRGDQ